MKTIREVGRYTCLLISCWNSKKGPSQSPRGVRLHGMTLEGAMVTSMGWHMLVWWDTAQSGLWRVIILKRDLSFSFGHCLNFFWKKKKKSPHIRSNGTEVGSTKVVWMRRVLTEQENVYPCSSLAHSGCTSASTQLLVLCTIVSEDQELSFGCSLIRTVPGETQKLYPENLATLPRECK